MTGEQGGEAGVWLENIKRTNVVLLYRGIGLTCPKRQKCVRKCVIYSRSNTRLKTVFTSWAVVSASPVRAWA